MRHGLETLGFILAGAAVLWSAPATAGDGATPAQIADLVDELRDTDAYVRAVARRELIALREKAVAPLVELLGAEGLKAGREAVQVLAAIGPAAKDAVPAITSRATRR